MNEAAQENVANLMGTMTGILVGMGLIIFLGYFIGKKIGQHRDPPVVVKWPVIGAVAIALVVGLQTCSKSVSRMDAERSAPAVAVVDGTPMDALPSEVNPDAVEQLRSGVEGKYNDLDGFESANGRLNLRASTIKLGGETVVYLHGPTTGGATITQYFGVVDGRSKVVSCMSPNGDNDPNCQRQAHETFGAPSASEAE